MRTTIPISGIKFLQEELQKDGLYSGKIDGLRTIGGGKRSQTDQGIEKALQSRQNELTLKASENSYKDWTDKRRAVAYMQLLLKDAGQNPGPADGLWGPQTDTAYDLKFGKLDPNWRAQKDAAPSTPIATTGKKLRGIWPKDNAASLDKFYGNACAIPTTKVAIPWDMKLAWDKNERVKSVSIHTKCADSLSRVFNQVRGAYTDKELDEYGLTLFGGSYNCRPIRGGTRPSTHSYAIALDFDPERNQLKWGANKAFLARPELVPFWQAWEAEGWTSLGRDKDYDWMHVQAADR